MIPFPFQSGQLGYVQPLPSGGGGVGSGWNPADKSANINLSDSNRTAQAGINTARYSVRSLVSKSSGKWYCEVLAVGVGGGTTFYIGFADGSASLNPAGVTSIGGQHAAWRENGQSIVAGALGSSLGTFGNGDRLMLAMDASTGKVWAGKNGTFNGNPAADTGQWTTLTVGSGLFIYFMSSASTTPVATIYTDAANQTYSPPSGFSALG